jgi:hypothetical protein
MDFVFTCPETGRPFNTGRFDIIDNHGVQTDNAGNKTLNARVKLLSPCPFCGGLHVYHASELSCPFDGTGKMEKDPMNGE